MSSIWTNKETVFVGKIYLKTPPFRHFPWSWGEGLFQTKSTNFVCRKPEYFNFDKFINETQSGNENILGTYVGGPRIGLSQINQISWNGNIIRTYFRGVGAMMMSFHLLYTIHKLTHIVHHTHKHTYTQTNKQTHADTGKQTNRQTDTQTWWLISSCRFNI